MFLRSVKPVLQISEHQHVRILFGLCIVLIFEVLCDCDVRTSPTVIGLPPSPRCFHSAVLLNEERIVIYGGYTSTAESDIWFLEVRTLEFKS